MPDPLLVTALTTDNTVVVETAVCEVTVTEEDGSQTVVVTGDAPVVITAITAGPQGPTGEMGTTLAALTDVDLSAAVDKSLLYFNATTHKVVATPTYTTDNITDGGNW